MLTLPRRMTAPLLALATGLLLACAPALSASATEPQPVQLSLKPVGQPGSYFDLTMTAGQSEQLQVDLGNHGPASIAARTYAADAYSIVNGGFGVKDRDSTPTGTTTWLNYPSQVLHLPAGQASTRTFTLTVPEGTPPGQYITALALENDVPVKGSGTVALNQLVRQAIAVSIRVPGALQPAFTLTTASHKIVAGRSVVDVGIDNTGNANLKPAGDLAIHDASGKTVARAPITMDSLYARTSTRVEATLAGTLQAGTYTADLTLTDPSTHTTETAKNLQFTVTDETLAKSAGAQQGQLPQILQSTGSVNPTILVAGALILLALILFTVLLLRHRRSRRSGPGKHAHGLKQSLPE